MDKGIKHKLSFEIHSMTNVNAIKITQYLFASWEHNHVSKIKFHICNIKLGF